MKDSLNILEGGITRDPIVEVKAINMEILIGLIIKDNYISYYWQMDNVELLVEMNLTAKDDNSTLVSISEKSRNNDVAGLKWLSGNSFGWSNFLACLKAYLEYGINLRKGAFDFMKK